VEGVQAPGARAVDTLPVGWCVTEKVTESGSWDDGAQTKAVETSSYQRWAGKAVDFGMVLDGARTWATEGCLRKQGSRVLR
jgi:hypothetical protein